MINLFNKHWPLIISVLVLWLSITVLLISSIKINHGHFGYPLDDTYIHMAMAKNVVLNGVWGADKYGFSSTTSSPLWTGLVSLIYFLTGVNDVTPFILNIILGTLLICIAYYFLRKFSVPSFLTFIALLILIYFTPLLPIIFGGMEHVLHAILTLLFVVLASGILSKDERVFNEYLFLLILALFVTTIRYEGLFMIFVVCLFFAWRKQIAYSIILGSVSIVPIVIYGIISMMKGWSFFPNSVLLKAAIPAFTVNGIGGFFYHGIAVVFTKLHMLILLLAAIFLLIFQYLRNKSLFVNHAIMLMLFLGITLLHLLFAETGWLYRYEAYLVSLGILAIAVGFSNIFSQLFQPVNHKKQIIFYLLLFVMMIVSYPLIKIRLISLPKTCYAIKNVYEQQYQMGMFLKQYYEAKAVAANDMGAINYLADIKCLDLFGIKSTEVLKAKRNGNYSTQIIDSITKQSNIDIAVIYPQIYNCYGGIPPAWIRAGEWTIRHNVVCAGNTVTFYAVNPSELEKLKQNLKTFSSQLPKDVIQTGVYLE